MKKDSFTINYNTGELIVKYKGKTLFGNIREEGMKHSIHDEDDSSYDMYFTQENEDEIPYITLIDLEDEVKITKYKAKGNAKKFFNPTSIIKEMLNNDFPFAICREYVKFAGEVTPNYFLMTDLELRDELPFYTETLGNTIVRDLNEHERKEFKAIFKRFEKVTDIKEGQVYELKNNSLKNYLNLKDKLGEINLDDLYEELDTTKNSEKRYKDLGNGGKLVLDIEYQYKNNYADLDINDITGWVEKDGRIITGFNKKIDEYITRIL